MNSLKGQIKEETERLEKMEMVLQGMRTPREKVQQYIDATESRKTAVNKKRKELDRTISSLKDEYKTLEQDVVTMNAYHTKSAGLNSLKREYEDTSQYLYRNIKTVLDFMETEGFLEQAEGAVSLTGKGAISSQLKEVNCLVFGGLISTNKMVELDVREMVELFSCFTNIVVADDLKTVFYKGPIHPVLREIIDSVNMYFYKYQNFETDHRIETGVDYSIHYDLVEYIGEWFDASNVNECKSLLQKIEAEKSIYLGEFVKAILKKNTITAEMEKIAETTGNMELLSKLKQIPENTLKFVATNQSLYL
jgi:superfamily II RNA helicase